MSSILIDDRDPLIVYSPGWQAGGLPTEYNSTTTYTDGGNATATITFHGVRIGVYGTIGSSNSNKTAPQSEYELDGNKGLLYQPNLTSLSQRNQRFYQSPELAKEEHTLVVRNLINGSSWLFLDYFVILTGETTSSTSSASSSDISPTAVSVTNGAASNQNMYIIAGTVGGGVTFVLLLFGIIYFWRRRRKHDEINRNLSMVQSVWMDSTDAGYWSPATTSLSRPQKFAPTTTSSHSPATSAPGPGPSKALRSTYLPSTSHLSPSSVYDSSYLPAPPEYKP